MVDRLRDFAVPYQHALETEASQRNVQLYLAGLLSHLDRKNAETIAALVDVERLVLQESLHLSQFVARRYWLNRDPSPHRFRANRGQRGTLMATYDSHDRVIATIDKLL